MLCLFWTQHAKLCAVRWRRSPSFMLRRPYADPMLLVGLTSIPVFWLIGVFIDLVWYVDDISNKINLHWVRWWTVRGQDKQFSLAGRPGKETFPQKLEGSEQAPFLQRTSILKNWTGIYLELQLKHDSSKGLPLVGKGDNFPLHFL